MLQDAFSLLYSFYYTLPFALILLYALNRLYPIAVISTMLTAIYLLAGGIGLIHFVHWCIAYPALNWKDSFQFLYRIGGVHLIFEYFYSILSISAGVLLLFPAMRKMSVIPYVWLVVVFPQFYGSYTLMREVEGNLSMDEFRLISPFFLISSIVLSILFSGLFAFIFTRFRRRKLSS